MPPRLASKPRFVSRKRRAAQSTTIDDAPVPVSVSSRPAPAPAPAPASPEPEPERVPATEPAIPAWRLEKEKQLVSQEHEQKLFAKTWTQKLPKEMSERDWHVMAQDLNISIKPEVPDARPLLSFDELPPNFRTRIKSLGYKAPTPVQRAAIPIGLSRRNIAAVAETGSGKTVGFLVPTLHNLNKKALILAPTRELAIQIGSEAAKFTDLPMAVVVGGRGIEEQADSLPNAKLIVATPGRLIDCLNQGMVVLDTCDVLVLDEADRMIDMGFEEQLTEILGHLPRKRQTLMFTATWPSPIEKLARELNPEMVKIEVTPDERRVTHNLEEIERGPKRLKKLVLVLKKSGKAIVFASTKAECDAIEHHLLEGNIKAVAMHGSKDQTQREAALADFRNNRIKVLVATDVAGRGIDIPDVTLVVNYDMPPVLATWVHRIGRTGRAGRKGATISFVDREDSKLYSQLRTFLRESHQKVPDFLKN